MYVESLRLAGLFLIKPKCFKDSRGYFFESWSRSAYEKEGMEAEFVQDNISHSKKDVVRGLHYQRSPGQAKLVTAISGKIWDVAVDIRPESKTYGQWEGVELSDENHWQFYIPIGFAHGYCVLSDSASVSYKVSSIYDPAEERTLAWNDPTLAIEWPVMEPILSERDLQGVLF